jgi:hypothetical protein
MPEPIWTPDVEHLVAEAWVNARYGTAENLVDELDVEAGRAVLVALAEFGLLKSVAGDAP